MTQDLPFPKVGRSHGNVCVCDCVWTQTQCVCKVCVYERNSSGTGGMLEFQSLFTFHRRQEKCSSVHRVNTFL